MDDPIPLRERIKLLQRVLGRNVLLDNPNEVTLADEDLILEHARAEMEPDIGASSSIAAPVASRNSMPPSRSEPDLDRAQDLEAIEFPEFGVFKTGVVAPKEFLLAPWKLILAYPQMYVGKTNKPVAQKFFQDDTIKGCLWDLFYIYHPDKPSQAVFFVPTPQFERFLNIINASAGLALTIPSGINSERFNITFGLGGQPRPRYLGRSKSPSEFEELVDDAPSFDQLDQENAERATRAGLDDLTEKLNFHKLEGELGKKSKKAAERARKRLQVREDRMATTLQYLGLRQHGGQIMQLDPDVPPPRSPSGKMVFLAVDIESMEGIAKTVVTEVGLSLLETEDLAGVAPGVGGKNWFKFIKDRHLRVNEHRHFRNTKWVQGCPESFDFGTSEFPAKSDLPRLIESIFHKYAKRFPRDGNDDDEIGQNIVIVGHDIRADMDYLAGLGVNINVARNYAHTIDTQDLHQVYRKKQQHGPRSLGYILDDLGIPNKNLHNAGNDAAYTLRAMLALAVNTAAEHKPTTLHHEIK